MQQRFQFTVDFFRRPRRQSGLEFGLAAIAAALLLTATAGSARSSDDQGADDDEEIEVYDSRSCPEIFGDEAVVEANRKRRMGRFHGVKRGVNDVTVTHQVAWWSEPQKLRIPAAVVVDVLPEDNDPENDASDDANGGTSSTDAPAGEANATETDTVAGGADAEGDNAANTSTTKAALYEEEAKAANAGAGLVVQHGSIANPKKPMAVAEELAVAHIELGDAYSKLCEPGVYEVSVDDSLGQDARVYAVLDEGMLVESGESLAFVVVDDGPTAPSMRMIWRSAYAIAFEDAAAASKVKKASKKKPKRKRKPRRRRRRKK